MMRASSRCQDCGNKAKKDCVYLRCRSCCKSRGFRCQTHVKSTWIPVSKRMNNSVIHQQRHTVQQQQLQRPVLDPSKRHSTEILSSGPEERNLPAELQILATFRCVQVRSQDNAVDQYAYQTAVNIGGHIFKGTLYDQGPENHCEAGGESSAAAAALLHPPNLISTSLNITTSATTACTALPSDSYPNVFNALFMPGTQYFPFPKS
ncbi:protein SHI RELATED SEQUENCE 3-like [Diospyros lotus]|uniref:protein SHI RELATED SEQUENCE 3-like n=1 Tax=Diospyros lotus TaxID=55363 RepID=UPI0022532D2E|nr:protein SHI RELATED SEQUENCE 3-like [Diospyros lotus]XP_052194330.1 protein SHI RELATED SEQUENCE 3-like [Diospyros lotus]XP_052194331.1 protein SHI RELATED SEQUENCE 3-like [Diospyros lotus]XP_052194332.1 protein SHI RELATED SEQUENCE 3-like [Diospyros lotus]